MGVLTVSSEFVDRILREDATNTIYFLMVAMQRPKGRFVHVCKTFYFPLSRARDHDLQNRNHVIVFGCLIEKMHLKLEA